MVAHAFSPSTQEAEAGESLQVLGQPGLEILSQKSKHKTDKQTNKQDILWAGGVDQWVSDCLVPPTKKIVQLKKKKSNQKPKTPPLGLSR